MEGKSLPSDSITGTVWSWAIDRGNWLSAAHIPGTSNVSADDLSRNFKADTEWALSNDVFPSCVVSAGCQILTFSRAGLITKTPSTLHWREFSNANALTPFCLVGRCLQKVMLPQATLTVVVPLWCMQAWFKRLLSLLMDHPRFFRVTKGVLHHPILGQMHPLSPKINLLACRKSGRGF